MADTAHLGLPLMEAGQAQKHVTHNEALQRLDAVVQLAVLDRDLGAPPSTPADGDRYIVATGGSGTWAGHDHAIAAWQDGVWSFGVPGDGWVAFAVDEATLLYWNGATWTTLQSAITALQNLTQLGVNTNADATSKLAIRSAAVLQSTVYAADGGSGDTQWKLNKETATDTASLLLQTGFSGRAEIGLTGDDNLHVKVSSDGATFTNAVTVDRTNGALTLASDLAVTEGGTGASDAATARGNLGAAANIDIQRFTASGTWTKPAAAKWVHLIVTGGGGGGGGGGKAASGTAVSGGGGGGGSGRLERWLDASAVGTTEIVTIGAGGTGGAGAMTVGAGGNGTAGGASSLGSTYKAFGGGAGAGGAAATASGGGAGGSPRAAGLDGSGSSGGSATSSLVGSNGGGGVGATTATATGGGAGGSGCSNAGVASIGPASISAGGGGGSGGGVSTANVFQVGGGTTVPDSVSGVAGGTSDGAAGASAAASIARAGAGGSGGAGSDAASGGAGGAGGGPGGGGGGGGGAHAGSGGSGGAGGRGEVLVVTYF